MLKKTRINLADTVRITDCSPELISLIDAQKTKLKIKSRLQYIEHLYGKPLRNRKNIQAFRKYVKSQGFKTIELWLLQKAKEERGD